MTDPIYSQILKKYKEVYAIQPNDLHVSRGTDMFKHLSPFLKEHPFHIIIPFAVIFSLSLLITAPTFAAHLTSILQYGF